jgi:hypothetical protein
MDVPGADRLPERAAVDGKSLVHDPERGPLARRAFEDYATDQYTKEQLLKRAEPAA